MGFVCGPAPKTVFEVPNGSGTFAKHRISLKSTSDDLWWSQSESLGELPSEWFLASFRMHFSCIATPSKSRGRWGGEGVPGAPPSSPADRGSFGAPALVNVSVVGRPSTIRVSTLVPEYQAFLYRLDGFYWIVRRCKNEAQNTIRSVSRRLSDTRSQLRYEYDTIRL